MDIKLLLPHKFKFAGIILLIPSFILGVLYMADIRFEIIAPVLSVWDLQNKSFSVINQDIYNELIAVFLLISLMMLSFSKEKHEDEYILKLRLESLLWSILINVVLLLLTIIFVYNDAFYDIMIYNMFTILIIFNIIFNLVLFKNRNSLKNEK